MSDNTPQRVRTVCTEAGYEDLWIEYDVSDWGIGTYNFVYGTLRSSHLVTNFVPRYSVAWHMVNRDGTTIAHPGKGAGMRTWASVWNQFDVATGRAIQRWLVVSVLVAIEEAMALSPKSSGDDLGDSGGEVEPERREQAEPAA